MVIDRNGQVLKSQTIPGLSGLYCDREGFYFYEAYNPEGKIRTGMLDATLQIVIPAETYETLAIATLQDYLIEPMDYLLASRSVKNAEPDGYSGFKRKCDLCRGESDFQPWAGSLRRLAG